MSKPETSTDVVDTSMTITSYRRTATAEEIEKMDKEKRWDQAWADMYLEYQNSSIREKIAFIDPEGTRDLLAEFYESELCKARKLRDSVLYFLEFQSAERMAAVVHERYLDKT